MDYSLQYAFEHPKVDPILRRLCHVSRLSIQATNAIGAQAQNLLGLLDPPSRINMINLFGAQFAALQMQLLTDINDITEVAFLSSRLQLWSYALLDDMPMFAVLPKFLGTTLLRQPYTASKWELL